MQPVLCERFAAYRRSTLTSYRPGKKGASDFSLPVRVGIDVSVEPLSEDGEAELWQPSPTPSHTSSNTASQSSIRHENWR